MMRVLGVCGFLLILLGIPLFGAGNPDRWIEPVDMDRIQDGTYQGGAKNWPVAADVEVQVAEHTITRIVITRHRQGRGKSAETIAADIIAAQSLKVDAVSGATLSSKTILQAVEQALKKGIMTESIP